MGNIVIYRDFRRGGPAECFPGIITHTYKDGDMCDLTIFSTTGVRYVARVKFSSDIEDEHSWHWPKEPEAKPVQLQETVPPIDKDADLGHTP